ncbi:MAG: MerR family DNA-binding transcriptional regulator, partial [Acidimicrobiales bacterium]|nr:MerR family DNA-binding transcriptional regulator [Acidimicrobiales bacterium]
MTRAPTDRSHLSIGEVLSLLQDEFPDVTISKIRFLESQGLLDPERTPSGYRKFYEADIDRLRWILHQQKDHYLPLKVIKDRLDDTGPIRTAPTAAGQAGIDASGGDDPSDAPAPAMAAHGAPVAERRLAAVALDERPAPRHRTGAPERPDTPSERPAPGRPAPTRPAPERRAGTAEGGRADVADVIEAPAPRPPLAPPPADPTLVLSPAAPAADPRRPAGGDSRAGRAPTRSQAPEAGAGAGAVSLTAEELI